MPRCPCTSKQQHMMRTVLFQYSHMENTEVGLAQVSCSAKCLESKFRAAACPAVLQADLPPPFLLRNCLQELEDELAAMRQELAAAREVAVRASSTWDKFRKERDFHRMHHKRVAQEKNKLITDIKRLKVWGPGCTRF
eukprot:GHRQ01019277.1.p1 GENE.GHRQ01019277.1~~GHRQ01019277.1.p1  ORF type:complete len:138 (+),score=30.47 GHRQ01019277.1:835-1248(+)